MVMRNRKRKYGPMEYDAHHCKWYITFDIDPTSRYGHNHNEVRYIRRRNDPIRKELGVTYQVMVCTTPREKVEQARRKVFKQLADEKLERRNKGNGKPARTNLSGERVVVKRKRSRGDITFFELHYVAMESYTNPEEHNNKEVLEELRRYYNKHPDKVRQLRTKVDTLSRDERQVIRDIKWVRLPHDMPKEPKTKRNNGTSSVFSQARAEPESEEDYESMDLSSQLVANPTAEAVEAGLLTGDDEFVQKKEQILHKERKRKLSEFNDPTKVKEYKAMKARVLKYEAHKAVHDRNLHKLRAQRESNERAQKDQRDTDVSEVSSNDNCNNPPQIHTSVQHTPPVRVHVPAFTGMNKPKGLGTIRLRRKESPSVPFVLPTEAWVPATKTGMPVARTSFADANLNQTIQSIRPNLLSEKEGYRLLQCFMEYRDPKDTIRVGRVQLETQSNVNFALPSVSLNRPW